MADDGQRTEKPTPRRLIKARKEGDFPSSREFLASIQFFGFVTITVTLGGTFLMRTAHVMRALLTRAFTIELTATGLIALASELILPEFEPLILAGLALVLLVIAAQLATTRLGISVSKLAPDFKRFDVLRRLTNLPGQNLPVFFQAVLLLPLVAMVVYFEATENLDSFLELPWMGAQVAASRIGGAIGALLWRAAGLFLVVGLVDLVWQRHRYTKMLRMTKQEIRDEHKETEGNPQIKMRVRRIQRDLFRRQMMKEVAKATAVIVNPTHYAVAIRYSMEATGAPKVVAKGKNYVAARIRKLAIEHEIPIVENAPLAQALYKSVEVGQEIPSHLYRAVAEILAYIYRLMNGNLPGG